MDSITSDQFAHVALDCNRDKPAFSTPQQCLSDRNVRIVLPCFISISAVTSHRSDESLIVFLSSTYFQDYLTPKGCGYAANSRRRESKQRQMSYLVKAANWLFGFGSSQKAVTKGTQEIQSSHEREIIRPQSDKKDPDEFDVNETMASGKTDCDAVVWQTDFWKDDKYEDAHLSMRARLCYTGLSTVLGDGLEFICDISCFLSRAATDYPAALYPVAVVDVRSSMEYSSCPITFPYPRLATYSALVAQCLRRDLNVRPGNVVAVLMRNSYEVMVVHYACAAIGAQLLNLNTQLVANEMALILAESGAMTIVANPLTHEEVLQEVLRENSFERCTPSLVNVHCMTRLSSTNHANTSGWLNRGEKLRWTEILAFSCHAAPLEFSSIAIALATPAHIYYTSGTSGKPKGVSLTHAVVARHAVATCSEMHMNNDDIWLHVAPMFHLVDAFAIYSVTFVGGRHVVVERFEASNALCTIEREGVTITNMASTMVAIICTNANANHFDLSSLRVLSCGGCPLAPASVTKTFSTFGCEFFISYGMTECCGKISMSIIDRKFLRSNNHDVCLATMQTSGRPFFLMDVKVVDLKANAGSHAHENGLKDASRIPRIGEVRVRGPTTFGGYLQQGDAQLEHFDDCGWFRTGDLATVDSNGYITIVDRAKDMILCGGENVYCAEVELLR